MASDESFKRPGTVPFKWELQPGIPKHPPAATKPAPGLPAPRLLLAPPPAARAGAFASASCRLTSSSAQLSPPAAPATAPQPSHRRSMSARFATSLVMPFTRRARRGGSAGAAKDGVDDFCLLYGEKIA